MPTLRRRADGILSPKRAAWHEWALGDAVARFFTRKTRASHATHHHPVFKFTTGSTSDSNHPASTALLKEGRLFYSSHSAELSWTPYESDRRWLSFMVSKLYNYPMIDSTDVKILAELQRDAGRPQKILAADIGLTEATLSKKIKRLIADRVILRYTIDISYPEIGYLFSALTMVKEKQQAETEITGRALADTPEAIQVFKVTGEWDFVVLWLCKDPEQLDRVISRVLSHSNVDRIQTTFFMRAIKRENGIPLDKIADQLT